MIIKIVITRQKTSPTTITNQVEVFTDDPDIPGTILCDDFSVLPNAVRLELRELYILLHEWTVKKEMRQ